jgi:hypothetical protein
MNSTFLFALTFAIASGDSDSFQEWMANEYIPALQETGCFLVEYKRLPDSESLAHKHMVVIRYTLFPKNRDAWLIFKENYRQEIEATLTEKWLHLSKTNKLLCDQIVGLEDERGTVMTIPRYKQ